jgi:hypothetical protein
VGGFPGGVFVIDISNIYSPRVRGRFYPGGEWAEGFTAVGRLIFWGGFESGDLIVIDATNPDTLQFYCSIGNDFCFPTAIYDKDSLLYVGTSCGYGGIASNAIEIIKIVSRDSSILLGKVDIDHYVGSITVEGATMYAVSDSGVVYSIDITDLTNPTIIFRCSPTAWGNTFPVHSVIKKTGEYLLVAERSGLSIINARKPEKLHRVSFFPTGGKVTKIVIKDNLAFIASYYSGLWILDISNPQKIKNISNVNVGARTVDVVVKDNLAYFVNFTYRENDTSRGLWIVDISDIYHPKILGHHIGIVRDPPSWDHHNAISRIDNYVVIAQVGGTTYDSTLEVVDVSNPLKPRNVSIIRSASLPYRIAIKDSILYVADAKLGLRIIDLHDPSNPKQLSLIKGRGRGIGLKDTLAFMFNPYLAVVNISDPHFPFVLYTSSIPPSDFNSIDMAVEGSFLYYAGTRNGGIVDISNPLNPVLKDTFRPKDRTFAVAAKGDTVYLSDFDIGIYILKNNLVTKVAKETVIHTQSQFELHQNYPNPFNGTTTIPISLDRKSSLTLTIYDILGRQIETIFKGELKAGKYTFQWSIESNRKPIESGIYFIVLQTDRNRSVRRAVYLK